MKPAARTALLIADLEGVAGVDTLDALAFGGEGHLEACTRMTLEVNAAIDGLVGQGFERVRVNDSHRSGSGVTSLGLLHPAAEPCFADCGALWLLDDVEAVACVGMHAAGGTHGFAAHTVEVHCAWLMEGRPVSEAELVFWLAAERGVTGVFAAGDDVLGAALGGLVPYVTTKQSKAIDWAISNTGMHAAIRTAASSPPRALPRAPEGPISLRFKTERTAAFDCDARGTSFTDRCLAALSTVVATQATLSEELGGSAAKATRLLVRPFALRPLSPRREPSGGSLRAARPPAGR